MKKAAFAISALALVAFSIGWAQTPEDDAAAIRQRVETYVTAYNQHDAAAVADLWSEDAVYVQRDSGARIQGRSAIAAMFQSVFESDNTSQLSVTIESIRLITADVAIEDGIAELTSADGEPLKSTYTAVHVKRDGTWFLDSVRETDTPSPPPAEPSPLDQLSWMIGSWLDQDEESTVSTTWRWAKNKKFLTSAFSVSVGEEIELEGTQVIGWDPAAGQIRSWIFDSEGGFGEGVWRHVGEEWISDFTMTLNDGSQASGVNVYKPVDDNTFTWKSVERQIDGEEQPDIEEVSVYRQSSE